MGVAWRYTPPRINALPREALAVESAVKAAADHILEASKTDVPVEEGVLKASGRVVQDGLEAAITYGRDDDGTADHAPSNQYVLVQHEDMSLHHPNGGGPKWLERSMNAEAEAAAELLAETIRRALEP